mmetsp:Transcript_35900/g.106097  ORF Transcript_35900/g.106097 Transcript_35900/m.106097 type:complete len:267 (-) Transcript_35900:505-1305(-)
MRRPYRTRRMCEQPGRRKYPRLRLPTGCAAVAAAAAPDPEMSAPGSCHVRRCQQQVAPHRPCRRCCRPRYLRRCCCRWCRRRCRRCCRRRCHRCCRRCCCRRWLRLTCCVEPPTSASACARRPESNAGCAPVRRRLRRRGSTGSAVPPGWDGKSVTSSRTLGTKGCRTARRAAGGQIVRAFELCWGAGTSRRRRLCCAGVWWPGVGCFRTLEHQLSKNGSAAIKGTIPRILWVPRILCTQSVHNVCLCMQGTTHSNVGLYRSVAYV